MIMLNEFISQAASSLLRDTDGDGQIQAIQLFNQLVNQYGGVSGLLNQLQNSDLGNIAQSWINSGDNIQPQASEIERMLGGSLGQAAGNLGINYSQASSLLAQFLPQIIHTITQNTNSNDADGFGIDDIARIALQRLLK